MRLRAPSSHRTGTQLRRLLPTGRALLPWEPRGSQMSRSPRRTPGPVFQPGFRGLRPRLSALPFKKCILFLQSWLARQATQSRHPAVHLRARERPREGPAMRAALPRARAWLAESRAPARRPAAGEAGVPRLRSHVERDLEVLRENGRWPLARGHRAMGRGASLGTQQLKQRREQEGEAGGVRGDGATGRVGAGGAQPVLTSSARLAADQPPRGSATPSPRPR